MTFTNTTRYRWIPFNQLLFQTFSFTHSTFLSLNDPLCFPLIYIFPFLSLKPSLHPALSLPPSSFDGLVVGGTDSARSELLSQCEMCCCGDDMSHFTLHWWCVWERERENIESRVVGSSLSAIGALTVGHGELYRHGWVRKWDEKGVTRGGKRGRKRRERTGEERLEKTRGGTRRQGERVVYTMLCCYCTTSFHTAVFSMESSLNQDSVSLAATVC